MPQVHFFKTSVITCYPHLFVFQSPGQIIEIDRHECFRETMRRRSSAISSACHTVTMEKTHGYFGDRKWWNMMEQYGSNHGEWIDLGIKTIKTHGKSNFQSSDVGRVEQILPGFSFGTSWKVLHKIEDAQHYTMLKSSNSVMIESGFIVDTCGHHCILDKDSGPPSR